MLEVYNSDGIGSIRKKHESITSLMYRWIIQKQDHKKIIKIKTTFLIKQVPE